MTPHARYITNIYYMAPHHAALFVHQPELARTFCSDYMPWLEIPIVGLAEVSESEERRSSVPIYTQTLNATLCQRAPLLPSKDYIFLLRCADGTQFLLGTALRPYPQVSQILQVAGSTSGVSAHTLTITHTSTMPLMEIVKQ